MNNLTNQSGDSNSNSSASASVGIALQLGASGAGLGFIGSVSKGGGNGNGTETTFTNTHIAGADSVMIKSGGDTNVKGATVEGNQVKAEVGGSLNIESLQDTSTYAEKNQQVGASGMVGITDKGLAKGNINYAKSNFNSNYASVTEQSGIKAGDGGFTVNVQGNTDLKGGAITSTQAAIDQNKNSFQTGGTLTTSDLQNHAAYDAKSVSVTLGTGSTPGQSASAGMSGVGIGADSGNANSITTAGISGIAGDAAKRTGDAQQGIKQIFNKDQVKADIGAQTAITSEFGKNAAKAVGDYAATKLKEAEMNNDPAGIEAWREGGSARVALHTVIGGLTGGTAGAVGAGSASAAAPSLDQLQTQLQQGLQSAGLGEGASKVIAGLTSGATAASIGQAVSGGTTAGAATAFNADMNNRQLSLPERQNALNLAAKSGGKYTAQQIEDALRLASYATTGETAASNMIIDPSKDKALGNNKTDPVASKSFDGGAVFNYMHGSVVQVDRNGQPLGTTTVSAELMAYIQANTGGANSPYKWVMPQAEAADPNAAIKTKVDPNWNYMGSNSAGIPTGTPKVPDGTYGVGYYQGVGGEMEVEVENGAVSAAKVGLGVGAGGHLNLGTKAVGGDVLQGAVGGAESTALVETNPMQSGEARVGISVGGSVGVGTIAIEGGLGGGVSGSNSGVAGYTNATITPTVSPLVPKMSAEIKANLIEISVKPQASGGQDAK